MACEIEYKGKVYDFAEFANMLHNGLLDEFIKDGYVKNVKTIESIS